MKTSETWNQWFGRNGEAIARRHLQRQGYRILDSRFRTPFGEIDLIAEKGGTISFIEVKSRRSDGFGDPFEAITPLKLRHMEKAADFFFLRNPRYRDKYFHIFEVVAVRGCEPGAEIHRVTLEL